MKKRIKSILTIIFTFIFSLLGFSIIWCLTTWTRLSMDELVFELSAPMRGVGSDMLTNFFLKCFLPAVVVTAATMVLEHKLTIKIKKWIPACMLLVSFIFATICTSVFWVTLDVTDYIRNLNDESTFIEDNYIDPADVNITFPEKKRNLIFIYLESMETTYASIEDGGGFEKGCIPELTELAREGECFSADDTINGGYVPYGTTWTMGAMFAHSTGLPLKVSVDENMMSKEDVFFPGVTAIGDILEKEGYNQELLIGSDGGFGGRQNFYQSHGNYAIHDIVYAKKAGILPQDYHVFWGYEDEKLFEYAKQDLLELSKKDEPFNLTMLTVDTHFPDGYKCRLCRDEFGNNQYANAMACSSRQVMDFVRWIQEQDFYNNTTLILCGDHTTMNDDFCKDIPDGYMRKKYTAFFNSAVEKVRTDENIQYSSLDMLPTTLAAMGAKVDGEQLGLGVNIYSGEKTLIEKYGFDVINNQFKKKSSFMESLALMGVDEETMHHNGWLPDGDINVISYDNESDKIAIEVDNIVNVNKLKKVYAVTYDQDMNRISKTKMKLQPDRSYKCEISLAKLPDKIGTVEILAEGEEKVQIGKLTGYLPLQAHESLETYAELLNGYENKAIIMASKGNFADSALATDFNVIRSMGITQKLRRESMNLYGVVDGPSRYYEEGDDSLTCDGVLLGNEMPIHIESSQEYAHILINGTDYSEDGNGLNIVVYDYDKEKVIDSACFELGYADRYHARMQTDIRIEDKRATITAHDIYIRYKVSTEGVTLRGILWDGTHYKKPLEFDINGDGSGYYTAQVDLNGYDMKDIFIELYIVDAGQKIEHRVLDWHGDLNLIKETFADYMRCLSENLQDKVIILSTKDDSVKNMLDEDVNVLKEMGLGDFLSTEEFGCSYAVITPDGVQVAHSLDDLSYQSEIGGTEIALNNSGWYNGYYSSVVIGGKEYSRNEVGINIVVYNTAKGCVEDRLTYNDNLWIDPGYRLER